MPNPDASRSVTFREAAPSLNYLLVIRQESEST